MNIHAAICDDDQQFTLLLKKYILDYFRLSDIEIILDIFSDSRGFLEKLRSPDLNYDLMFLDIDMPGLNGLDLASEIKHIDRKQPYFIFVSGMESMVFKTFRVNPFWFVRKRLWKKELPLALSSLKKELRTNEEHLLSIEVGTSIYKIDTSSLIYIECTDKTLHFHYEHPEKDRDIRYKLSDLEKLLTDCGFIRIHKGFLVNYRFIFNIERSGIQLDNGITLPVSKYRLQEIKELYGRLI